MSDVSVSDDVASERSSDEGEDIENGEEKDSRQEEIIDSFLCDYREFLQTFGKRLTKTQVNTHVNTAIVKLDNLYWCEK